MQEEQFHQQRQNDDTLYQPIVSNAQYNTDTENYLDVGIKFDYEQDKISQAYGEIVSRLGHLTKDTFQP